MKKQNKEKAKKITLRVLHIIGYICTGVVLIVGIALGVNSCNSNVRQVNAESSFDINATNVGSNGGLKIQQNDLYYLDANANVNNSYIGSSSFTINFPSYVSCKQYIGNYESETYQTYDMPYPRLYFDLNSDNHISLIRFTYSNNGNNSIRYYEPDNNNFVVLHFYNTSFNLSPNSNDDAVITFNSYFTYCGNSSEISYNVLKNCEDYYNDNYIKVGQRILMPFVYNPLKLSTYYYNYGRSAYLGLVDHNDYWYRSVVPSSNLNGTIDVNYFYNDGTIEENVSSMAYYYGEGNNGLYIGASLFSSSPNQLYLGISVNKNSFIYNAFFQYCYLYSNASNGYVNTNFAIQSNYHGSFEYENGVFKNYLTNAQLYCNGQTYSKMGSYSVGGSSGSTSYQLWLGNEGQTTDQYTTYVLSYGGSQTPPVITYGLVNYEQFLSLIYDLDSSSYFKLVNTPSGNFYNEVLVLDYNTTTEQGLTSIFGMLTSAFNSISKILSISLFGNITIGIILFLPLVVTIIIFIVKMFKR